MKNYLSFGGGVNSVAMMLLLLKNRQDFETIFVDHGADWPETYEYFSMFQERWPLIEQGVDRDGCKEIIKRAGLPVPIQSGCYCCPFQRKSQFKALRKNHPDLFCKVEKLEDLAVEYAKERGYDKLENIYLRSIPIRQHINENQRFLFNEDEYPPCQCGL